MAGMVQRGIAGRKDAGMFLEVSSMSVRKNAEGAMCSKASG